MTSLQDQEITLTLGDQRAVVSNLGASLRHYFRIKEDGNQQDILWGYKGAANKQGGQGDVLIPFPSRIKNGHYKFQGQTHQMPINDREGPNAIHGFLRTVFWEFKFTEKNRVSFHTQLLAKDYAEKGYPFSLNVTLSYELSKGGLTCRFEVENIGTELAPFGIGFHPYFTVNTAHLDDAEVEIPATEYLEFESLVPTGKLLSVAETSLDFRKLKKIETAKFNHCFTKLIRDENGTTRAILRNPETKQRTTIWMDKTFDFLVVYTGEAIPAPFSRKAIAIEPMTCGTDAFNHEESADWGLLKLEPGTSIHGSFGISSK